ncbi:MAG: hypothetical protein MUF72_20080 [Elainella sp. Prado103]|nr:hypothetical protein [Elainella sp. Prado103]
MNLIDHAIDAIGRQGTLEIAAVVAQGANGVASRDSGVGDFDGGKTAHF